MSDAETVGAVARRLLAHPWRTAVLCWNWKAGLLSALFRAGLFLIVVVLRGPAALSGVWIEMIFRLLLGGFWGALVQSFRLARPAWLAAAVVAVGMPVAAHAIEFAALVAAHTRYVRTGMVVSVIVSGGSLLINWGLMRRGLLLTGEGTESLGEDMRRLPRALADLARWWRRAR